MTILLSILLIAVSVVLLLGTAWHVGFINRVLAALKDRDDRLGIQADTIALQKTQIKALERLNKVTYHALMSEDDWDAMSKTEFEG